MGRDTAVNCPCAQVLVLWILLSNYFLGRVGVGEGRGADALFSNSCCAFSEAMSFGSREN